MAIRSEVLKAKSTALHGAPTQGPYRSRFVATLLACGACDVWLTSPVAAVAAVRAPLYAKAPTGRLPQLPGTIEPQVCASCTPPLIYYRGPVMDSNGAKGVTITPIWWQPSGGRFFYPSFYRDLIDQYITDIAAASGSTDNVYSIDTEYYDKRWGGEDVHDLQASRPGPRSRTPTPFPPTDVSRRRVIRPASQTASCATS